MRKNLSSKEKQMEQIELPANNRVTLGKEVRFLRRQGITPVHLFGHDLKSLALQCQTANLERSLAEAGETRLVTLKVRGEKKARSVLVREVQREALTSKLLHVDFYQVKMDEKVEVEIPIVLVGEAPALQAKGNRLLRELDTLTIECLPSKIPTSLEVKIGSLTEAGQAVRVKDIAVDSDITVLSGPEQVVVTVIAPPEEEEKVLAEEVLVKPPEEAKQAEDKPKQE
jgi:large subunit ribosomal protein L25